MKVCQNVTELSGREFYTSVMNERNIDFIFLPKNNEFVLSVLRFYGPVNS